MSKLIVLLQMFLARHRWKTAIALALAGGGLLACTLNLRFSENISDMLPLADPRISGTMRAEQLFSRSARMFVDVSSTNAGPETLGIAADAMTGRLSTIPGMAGITHRMDAEGANSTIQYLYTKLPCYFDEDAANALTTKLSSEALATRMAWLKERISGPGGAALKRIAVMDPIGAGDALASGLRELQAGFSGMRVVAGRLTSEDGHHILILATPEVPVSETLRSRPIVEAVLSAARAVEQEFAGSGVRIAVGGGHRVALDNVDQIKRDAARTMLVDTVALMALIWLVYRRRWMAFFTIMPSIFAVLFGSGVLFFVFGSVSAIALGFGSVLLGITIDNAVHVIYHLENDQPEGFQAAADSTVELVFPIATGVLTTMATFGIMCLSSAAGHRQVGLYAMAGVPVAAVVSVLFLPLLVPHRKGGKKPALWLTKFFGRFFLWLEVHARHLLPLVGVFTVVCLFGIGKLSFDGDASHLNYMTPETTEAQNVLETVWSGALSLTTIVVEGDSLEDAMQKNEKLHSLLRQMHAAGEIKGFMSIAPLLPSSQAQNANLARWREFWTTNRVAAFRSKFEPVVADLGFRREVFQPFLDTLSAGSDSVSLPGMKETSIGEQLAKYVYTGTSSCAVVTMVKAEYPADFVRLSQMVSSRIPGALIVNGQHFGHMIEEISKEGLIRFGVMVTLVTATVLFLVFGRPMLVLITLLPVFSGLFWTLGTLGLLGYAINLANMIFVVFVFGVCIDYSLLHVTGKLGPARGYPCRLASTGGSVSICAATSLIGIGVLVLARHPALFAVGVTALLGIAFSLLSTVVLVPLCMDAVLKRHFAARPPPRKDVASLRKHLYRLYGYQGPYVEQYVFWKTKTDPMFPLLDECVPANARVLDLGTGYGLVPQWLRACSPDLTFVGIDYDADKIRVAKAVAQYSQGFVFKTGNLVTEPYPLSDAALLMDVLHYMPDAEKKIVLGKAHGALTGGGLLVMRDANRSKGLKHRLVDWGEIWAVLVGHNMATRGLYFASTEEYMAMLAEAGFHSIKVHSNGGLGSNVFLTALK
ncbi:MAG: MMPL family transporter [bacterium]